MLVRRMAMARRGGPGLMRTAAATAVVAGTATAVSGRVQRRQDAREAEHYAAEQYNQQQAYAQQQQAYAQQQQAYAQPGYAAPPSGGITDEQLNRLERLADLQKAGVLSPQEFEAQKAEILGR
jgi:hypothetical protein